MVFVGVMESFMGEERYYELQKGKGKWGSYEEEGEKEGVGKKGGSKKRMGII